MRERLGIVGRWPYYLCKEGDGASAIAEPVMIWQAALFSRFVFRKANQAFILKQTSVLQWVLERFDVGSNSIEIVHAQVRRYLGYLSACGFLKKAPYNPYESQGYIVVHGELEPPVRLERSPGALKKQSELAVRDITSTAAVAPVSTAHWIWRASWPQWSDVADEVTATLAESAHAPYLAALLNGISPLNRPADPLECAEILEEWGVPRDEVMSFLQRLGLVLRRARPLHLR